MLLPSLSISAVLPQAEQRGAALWDSAHPAALGMLRAAALQGRNLSMVMLWSLLQTAEPAGVGGEASAAFLKLVF